MGKPPSHTRGTQGACAAAYSFISTIGVGFVQCVLGAELCRSHLTVWILSWCLTKLVGLQVSSLRNLSVEKEPEGFGWVEVVRFLASKEECPQGCLPLPLSVSAAMAIVCLSGCGTREDGGLWRWG